MTSSRRTIADLVDGQDESPRKKRRLNDSILSLTPTDATTLAPPPFQQPFQLLSFSYTSLPSPDDTNNRIRSLEWNNASMKYFVSPPSSANLAYGYERWIKRPEERGRLDGLLEACLRDECEGERRRADAVTWRGVMTKILTAPYEDRDGWDLNVMYVAGTLYIEEHLSEEKLREKSIMSGNHRLMSYYGYAFESYCTTDSPPVTRSKSPGSRQSNGWSGDVDTNIQWCSVVKTKIGSTRMILGGEVDCIRDRNTGQPDTFVELKTSIAIRPGNKNDEAKFEKKLLKFYFQSFLLGVPEIFVGFRTPSGYLQTTQSFKTMDLPRHVRGKPNAWDPAVCLTWGARVFDFIRLQIQGTDEDERGVWRIKFTPRIGLSMRKLDDDDVAEVRDGEDRVGFLPQWYWDRAHETYECGPSANTAPAERRIPVDVPEVSNPEQGNSSAVNSRSLHPTNVQGWQV